MAVSERTARGATPYRSGRVGGSTLVALPSVYDALAERLRAFDTLYTWAEEQPQARALQGRGVVYVADLPECDETVAVRHAWHGGLLAPLTGDRFLVPTRAPREAAVSVTLRARGIDTPDLLAYALYPAGPGLRRVDVCTRYVPDSWDFGAVLGGLAPVVRRADAERALVDLLVRMARAGALHPDLNVKNVLLVAQPDGALRAWLLDVDVVELLDNAAIAVMRSNLNRLSRSIRKWYARHDMPADEPLIASLAVSAMSALA